MPKLRSFFFADLDLLRSSITSVLAKSAEGAVESLDISNLFHRLECVSLTLNNREFSDLIRKK